MRRWIKLLEPWMAALVVAAIAGSSDALAQTKPVPPIESQRAITSEKLKLGYVPSLSASVLNLGVERGTFATHGINLELDTIDAGPAVITSVINGSYDLAVAAPFPVLIALSKGAPLKAVTQINSVAPGEGNSGALVAPGSKIKSYRDLEGKNIATNALTSLTTLAIKAAVDTSGGDSSKVKVTALPFLQANQAVKQSQADASIVLEPFVQLGIVDGLELIGDPIADYIPRGSSYGLVFTSANTLDSKADAITRFVAALQEVADYANAHPDALVASAIKNAKLDPKLAARLPIPKIDPTINKAAMLQLADLMTKYHYLTAPVNLASFVPVR